MNTRTRLLLIFAALLCVVFVLQKLFSAAAKPPVAWVYVVDAAGKPIAGAIVHPEGLRTKSGPYASGWYSWNAKVLQLPNDPVATDQDGFAKIPYPKHVFEQIETGVIIPSINHPDYVPAQPELVVDAAPPRGSPLRGWVTYLWDKILNKPLVARTDKVVLQKGAILKISARPGSGGAGTLFAQVSVNTRDTNFWIRPEPGVLMTRRLAAGSQMVRAVQLSTNGAAWFSDVLTIQAVSGRTNDVVVDLKPGVSVRGQLDDTVPRPVKNGRVVAQICPTGFKPQNDPPEWHAWTTNREDGSFEFTNLPPGDLEIVALCEGFVSTNRPAAPQFRHPQKHLLGTNGLSITVGMEPTARLEILVTDDKGNPLKGAQVATWPNVHYGDWAAVVLMGDLYNTADHYLQPVDRPPLWSQQVPDLNATTDSSGLAVLPNLPSDVREFVVDHPKFQLPAITTGGGGKHRQQSVTLTVGKTNRSNVQLEPRDQSPIAHY